MMRPGLAIGALALWFALASCTAEDEPTWPDLGAEGQEFAVAPARLPTASLEGTTASTTPDQSPAHPEQFFDEFAYPDLENGALRDGVVVHHYPHMTVAGHYRATGTYVFYDTNNEVFYLWGDDWMGHYDGVVGPFAGDPRLLLPEAGALAEPQAAESGAAVARPEGIEPPTF